MTTLTPAALSFLSDIGVRYGLEEARRLGAFMTDGTIAELDGKSVLQCDKPAHIIGAKDTPGRQEQLRFETKGTAA